MSLRENPLSENKHDETFKVVDRRLFTAEGELRKEVAEQQDRENDAAAIAAKASAPKPQSGSAASVAAVNSTSTTART